MNPIEPIQVGDMIFSDVPGYHIVTKIENRAGTVYFCDSGLEALDRLIHYKNLFDEDLQKVENGVIYKSSEKYCTLLRQEYFNRAITRMFREVERDVNRLNIIKIYARG